MTEPTDLVPTLREALADNYDPERPWAVEIDFQDGYPAIYARNDELMEMSGVAWKLEGGKAALIVAAVNALPGLLDEVTVSRLLIDHLTQTPPGDGWTVEETNQWHTRRRALLEAHGIAREANTKETP